MNLRVRRISFSLKQDDYVRLKECNVLSKLFDSNRALIVEKTDEHVAEHCFEITGSQFAYKKLDLLQKALPTLRFTSLSDVKWVENGILKSKTGTTFCFSFYNVVVVRNRRRQEKDFEAF